MKFLICLFAVLAVANAGLLAGNAAVYSSGSYISSPVSYVHQAAPIVQSVQVVRQPIHHHTIAAAPVYHHSAPIVAAPIVAAPIVSAPIVTAPIAASVPIVSHVSHVSSHVTHHHGLTYGGFLKRQ